MIDPEFRMIITRQEQPQTEYFLYEVNMTGLLRLKQAFPKKVRIDYQTLETRISSGLPYDITVKILKYIVVNLIKDFKFDDAVMVIRGFNILINDFYNLFYDDGRKTPIFSKIYRIDCTFHVAKTIVRQMLVLDTEPASDNLLASLDTDINFNFPVLDLVVPLSVAIVHPYHCINGQSHIGEFIALMGWQWVRTGLSFEFIETFAFKGEQEKGIWKVSECAWPLIPIHLICDPEGRHISRKPNPDTRSWTMLEEVMRLCCGQDFTFKFI